MRPETRGRVGSPTGPMTFGFRSRKEVGSAVPPDRPDAALSPVRITSFPPSRDPTYSPRLPAPLPTPGRGAVFYKPPIDSDGATN